MATSSSFAVLAKAKAAQLHCRGMQLPSKEIKEKLSLIKLMSSIIQVASKRQALSEFKRSTSSTKFHSTITFKKLVFWQNKSANLITKAAVQRGFKFFCRRWHDVAKTWPLSFLARKPSPTELLVLDWEIAKLSLWIESEAGGCHFAVWSSATRVCLCCTSTNSNR